MNNANLSFHFFTSCYRLCHNKWCDPLDAYDATREWENTNLWNLKVSCLETVWASSVTPRQPKIKSKNQNKYWKLQLVFLVSGFGTTFLKCHIIRSAELSDTRLNNFTVLAFYHPAFKSQHRHWWPELFLFFKHPSLHLCTTEFFPLSSIKLHSTGHRWPVWQIDVKTNPNPLKHRIISSAMPFFYHFTSCVSPLSPSILQLVCLPYSLILFTVNLKHRNE